MAEHSTSDELFWTAARYAWGELSPEETAAFEDRLAHDEAACLAVAEAVRLTLDVKSAAQNITVPAPVDSASPKSNRTQHRSAGAWLTVALLAMAATWFVVQQAVSPARVDPASMELLARWTDAGELADGDFFDDLDAEPELLDESLTAPGWLVQAVQLADDLRTPQP